MDAASFTLGVLVGAFCGALVVVAIIAAER